MILDDIRKSLASVPPFKKVVVGVSGGVDSVVLAYLLNQLGYRIIVAHVNHSLRGAESDQDAAFVESLCCSWGVPFESCKITVPKKGNLENEARKKRYTFLESIRLKKRASYIVAAHHQDDQIETVYLHKERGSGLRGLKGMNLITGRILRPMLTISKSEILAFAEKHKLPFRHDSSNSDQRFMRNYLRQSVFPTLRKKDPDFDSKMLQLSMDAGEVYSRQKRSAERWIRRNVTDLIFSRHRFRACEPTIQTEILLHFTGRRDIYRKELENLRKLVLEGRTGSKRTSGKMTFQIAYEQMMMSPSLKPVPAPTQTRLSAGDTLWGQWLIKKSGNEKLFVRGWKPGDRFRPLGLKGSKKLQDLFTDLKIPRADRNSVPIIVDEKDRILSVSNIRVAVGGAFLKKCLQIKSTL